MFYANYSNDAETLVASFELPKALAKAEDFDAAFYVEMLESYHETLSG